VHLLDLAVVRAERDVGEILEVLERTAVALRLQDIGDAAEVVRRV